MTRVVITGIGVSSPVGSSQDDFWAKLTAGESGVGPITLFDASALPVRIGGEVKGLNHRLLGEQFPEAATQRDRKIWLALDAAGQAVADAGLAEGDLQQASLHVGVGLEVFALGDVTPHAESRDIPTALAKATLNGDGPAIQTPLDTTADLLGARWGLHGGRWVNCSACAAGAQVIGEAFHWLGDGEGSVALVGATDSMLNPLGLGGFSLLRVLSTDNDRPQSACRPFDADRKGTVLGEGAAFLVLETQGHANVRGAKVYAELLGYGSSMDAHAVSDPDPSGNGARLSMSKALSDAGMEPGEIDCVNAHGTGTAKNDAMETSAIKAVLGRRARAIPVHAVKSMTGHLIAASGAVEAVAAALTISRGLVPPTINLTTPDPQCDLDYVADGARAFAGRTVMSNS